MHKNDQSFAKVFNLSLSHLKRHNNGPGITLSYHKKI